jgi:hypothetical protein
LLAAAIGVGYGHGFHASAARFRIGPGLPAGQGLNMAIFKSRFAIGDRVKIRYYSGTAVVAAVRFTKDKILYDVDRDLGGKTLRDVDSNDIGPAR